MPRLSQSPSHGPFLADLHIHSKYSRACSRDLELDNLAWWAQRKGITLLGTGDFTHPAWYDHLREHLRADPDAPGLFRLDPDREAAIARRLPASVHAPVRFMLSVEISTIYKRDDRTRKVHHLIYLPDLDAVARFNARLGHGPGGLGGNLGSDGRPILGLDSRDLLEITLEASEHGFLVPAHIWTPWFSALGSKSGFDSIADCYADLAGHIHAVETGLSSDPEMNWRVASLDRYQLVSNSDAHSPRALAREATTLTCPLDYLSVKRALETGEGLHGTVEFFPEEGKYHADGHRACGVRWDPAHTRAVATGDRPAPCPECGKPVTIGVLHRVEELADRPDGYLPPARRDPDEGPSEPVRRASDHLVPLAEIIGEINRVGAKSKTVEGHLARLIAALGPELHILTAAPLDEIGRVGGELLGEAVKRLRRGQVQRIPGFDGEYGVIRLFEPGELRTGAGRGVPGTAGAPALFEVPAQQPASDTASAGSIPQAAAEASGSGRRSSAPGRRRSEPDQRRSAPGRRRSEPAQRRNVPGGKSGPPPLTTVEASPHHVWEPVLAGMEEVGTGLLDRLDAMQRVAASAPGGPLLIVAGPGTGKTRTLTHRIAYLCAELGVFPEQCLAITFTRRAAEELQTRLAALLGPVADDITVGTFHAVGLSILRDAVRRNHPAVAGLTPAFQVADDPERLAAMVEAADLPRDSEGRPTAASEREGRKLLAGGLVEPPGGASLRERYQKLLRERDRVDLDDLIELPVALLRGDPALADRYQARWRWVFVDEYQDVDAVQYELLRLLVPADGNLCAIGDPDQAIYSFRGADVSHFLRFSQDFTDARIVRLARNYRSSAPILAAATQVIAPSSLVRGRRLDPARLDPDAPQAGLHRAATAGAEAEWVAKMIDELVGGVSHRSFDAGRVDSRHDGHGGLSFADIAVLYRTDAQAAPIVAALTRAGIPVQKRSHDRLADRRAVAEIARELRFAGTAGAGTATGPAGGSPSAGHGGSLVERVRAAGRALATRAPRLFEHDGAPPADLAETDVYAAVEVLTPLAEQCGEDLESFLQALATGAEVDALDPRAQAVTLLTLHAAKGLEWPVVFMVGCEDGLLPLRLPGAPELTEEAVAEERRLFFVGMTRAQDRLLLSHARRRARYGAEREMPRTPFLGAVDPSLIELLGDQVEPRRPQHRQLRLI